MSGELFEDWVHKLDRKSAVSKRKIALIIDNCTAHPHVENLKWVKLIILPPNTTSHIQPMDQGSCSLAVRKLILALEEKELIPTFSIHVHAEKSMRCYLEPEIHQLFQKIGNLEDGC